MNDIANLLENNNGILMANPIVGIIARAKTLTFIWRLDNSWSNHLIQFWLIDVLTDNPENAVSRLSYIYIVKNMCVKMKNDCSIAVYALLSNFMINQ